MLCYLRSHSLRPPQADAEVTAAFSQLLEEKKTAAAQAAADSAAAAEAGGGGAGALPPGEVLPWGCFCVGSASGRASCLLLYHMPSTAQLPLSPRMPCLAADVSPHSCGALAINQHALLAGACQYTLTAVSAAHALLSATLPTLSLNPANPTAHRSQWHVRSSRQSARVPH